MERLNMAFSAEGKAGFGSLVFGLRGEASVGVFSSRMHGGRKGGGSLGCSSCRCVEDGIY